MKKKFISGIIQVIVALGLVVLSVVISKVLPQRLNFDSRYRVQYEKEAELAYWNVKYLLNTEVQKYIDSVAPTSNLRAYEIIESCEKYQVDIKFVLAQGEKESHFGTKGLAAKTNSVWNAGAYDGLNVDSISKIHKFTHPNQSVNPYLELLVTRYLVGGVLEVDLMQKYVDIDGRRYATDPNYEIALTRIYDSITANTNIDSLQNQLRYYRVKCGR